MPKVEIKEPTRVVEIEVAEGGEGRVTDHLSITDPQVLEFLGQSDSFAKAINITKILLERTADADEPVYHYRVEGRDGRVWEQDIRFTGGYGNADPHMTFNVTDLWKQSEFQRQRSLRDTLVAIINRWWVIKIEITYP